MENKYSEKEVVTILQRHPHVEILIYLYEWIGIKQIKITGDVGIKTLGKIDFLRRHGYYIIDSRPAVW